MAKQAAGAAVVTYGETAVLVTVARDNPRPGIDFFPLTVDFVEKTSAAILVLLGALLSMNGLAIYLRRRWELEW